MPSRLTLILKCFIYSFSGYRTGLNERVYLILGSLEITLSKRDGEGEYNNALSNEVKPEELEELSLIESNDDEIS